MRARVPQSHQAALLPGASAHDATWLDTWLALRWRAASGHKSGLACAEAGMESEHIYASGRLRFTLRNAPCCVKRGRCVGARRTGLRTPPEHWCGRLVQGSRDLSILRPQRRGACWFGCRRCPPRPRGIPVPPARARQPRAPPHASEAGATPRGPPRPLATPVAARVGSPSPKPQPTPSCHSCRGG